MEIENLVMSGNQTGSKNKGRWSWLDQIQILNFRVQYLLKNKKTQYHDWNNTQFEPFEAKKKISLPFRQDEPGRDP